MGASWACLGRVLARLGRVMGHLGWLLDRLGAILGRPGGLLNASWARLGPSWERLKGNIEKKVVGAHLLEMILGGVLERFLLSRASLQRTFVYISSRIDFLTFFAYFANFWQTLEP